MAALSVSASRDGISHHGAVLNVNPAMADFEFIDVVDPNDVPAKQKTIMSSLFAEHRQPVKMTGIRSALIQFLAQAFEVENYHLYTGHPWLKKGFQSEFANRAD